MTSANHAETTFSDFPNLGTKDRSETVVRRCSLKKMFLKISQISEESTCIGASF